MAKYYAESERLWLQPLNVEDHLEGYHAMASDERIVKWSSVIFQVVTHPAHPFPNILNHSFKD
jgi:hypothetical protein